MSENESILSKSTESVYIKSFHINNTLSSLRKWLCLLIFVSIIVNGLRIILPNPLTHGMDPSPSKKIIYVCIATEVLIWISPLFALIIFCYMIQLLRTNIYIYTLLVCVSSTILLLISILSLYIYDHYKKSFAYLSCIIGMCSMLALLFAVFKMFKLGKVLQMKIWVETELEDKERREKYTLAEDFRLIYPKRNEQESVDEMTLEYSYKARLSDRFTAQKNSINRPNTASGEHSYMFM